MSPCASRLETRASWKHGGHGQLGRRGADRKEVSGAGGEVVGARVDETGSVGRGRAGRGRGGGGGAGVAVRPRVGGDDVAHPRRRPSPRRSGPCSRRPAPGRRGRRRPSVTSPATACPRSSSPCSTAPCGPTGPRTTRSCGPGRSARPSRRRRCWPTSTATACPRWSSRPWPDASTGSDGSDGSVARTFSRGAAALLPGRPGLPPARLLRHPDGGRHHRRRHARDHRGQLGPHGLRLEPARARSCSAATSRTRSGAARWWPTSTATATPRSSSAATSGRATRWACPPAAWSGCSTTPARPSPATRSRSRSRPCGRRPRSST